MKVINNTSFKICAHCWHIRYGQGTPEVIFPGKSKKINGPLIAETNEGKGYIHLTGEVTCQETPDDENGFQVTPKAPLHLTGDAKSTKGVTIEFATSDLFIF